MNLNGYSYKVKVGKEEFRAKPFYHYDTDQASAFDIPGIIGNLKKEQNWLDGDLNSVVLLNSPRIKVLLTIMHEDTEVISYQASDSITFQVIEGSLVMHIRDETIVLNAGELLTLDEKIRYSFDTIEETAFLLTLVSEKESTED
jgi:quercetin dioxygenase-like cupin family protein